MAYRIIIPNGHGFWASWLAIALSLVTNTWTHPARAQAPTAHPELRFDNPWLDGVVTGVGFAGWVTTSVAESTYARASCR